MAPSARGSVAGSVLSEAGDRKEKAKRVVNGATGHGAEAATFFGLDPAETPFCGSFPCSLRGTPGQVYVFEFAIGFAAEGLAAAEKWSTPAIVVNDLEITSPTSLEIGLATGPTVKLDDVARQDETYDCMVTMLEKLPPSSEEDGHAAEANDDVQSQASLPPYLPPGEEYDRTLPTPPTGPPPPPPPMRPSCL